MFIDNIVIFAVAAFLFQAGWMIDFSLTKEVYVPFLNKTYQVKGSIWFDIALLYLFLASILPAVLIYPDFKYFAVSLILNGILIALIADNREKYLTQQINLTVYGQRYNILFYILIAYEIAVLFLFGVF